MPVEDWDPLHRACADDALWTTTNVGEAIPGVATPLTASLWQGKPGRGLYYSGVSIGAFKKSEATDAAAQELFGFFYGHAALRVEFLAELGDRLPGTSGREVVVSILGRVPEGMTFAPTRRRYPVVAVKFLHTFVTFPREVRRAMAEHDGWWRDAVGSAPGLSLDGARALLEEADAHLDAVVLMQTCCVLSCVSPVHDALVRVVEGSGREEMAALLSPVGGAEMAVVRDLWAASRGELTINQVIGNHGFHGPNEGETSATVWRDDPAPVHALVRQYRDRPDEHDPGQREERQLAERSRLETELIAATGPLRRGSVRLVLRLARSRLALRGLAKRGVVQSTDAARIAARAIGGHLVRARLLEQPDDVFYLTKDELLGELPGNAKDLVVRRRERRQAYLDIEVPSSWQGTPPATGTAPAAAAHPAGESANGAQSREVRGIGVSPGIVEGVCRVVLDPAFAEVEPDEILVAPTTDPSWSSIMFVSAGLVVDIGGVLSHASVVARELGLPCVVNTRNGSSVLRTGDRVRIDGTTGVVQVLARADELVADSRRAN